MRKTTKKHVSKHSEKNLNASKAIRKNTNEKNDRKTRIKTPYLRCENIRKFTSILIIQHRKLEFSIVNEKFFSYSQF